ncbi:unnamed protein product [Phytomonas sp. Hart1]|nr:unnamed protein product [Phytomonas sp. Hart1]|eukprot:CCW70510.1 unnamed protein product [Phytomonas sp. isolate Hart1]
MCSAPAAIPPSQRYFNCFYESFKAPNSRKVVGMQTTLQQTEKRCRLILGSAEANELRAIAHCFGYDLHRFQPQLLSYITLDVVSEEKVHRRLIESRFFDMMLEACMVMERLRRVKTLVQLEDAERRILRSLEVQQRVLSMRAEKERQADVATNEESLPHGSHTTQHFDRKSDALLLLQIEEKEARLAIQRQQFLLAVTFNDYGVNGVKANQRAQDRHELLNHPLGREEFSRLCSEEFRQRTFIMQESHVAFRAIAAEETKAFCQM